MRKNLVGVFAMVAVASLAACPGSDEEGGGASSSSGGSSGTSASGPPRWMNVPGDRLGPLPQPGSATTTRFTTSETCAQCHLAGEGAAVRDAKGRDVSPVGTWRTSAMALAARDPYYLAAFADELAFRPNLASTVEQTCTRCHAPAASLELEVEGKTPTFAMLTTGADTSNAAHLGREGVACSMCHQIDAEGLGTYASFTGQFKVLEQRRIYGPYQDPLTDPMRTLINYVPMYGAHIQQSSLCATCHTVITKPRDSRGYVGPDFPEQVPFLEWLASSYADGGTRAATCQDCHMQAADDDGATLEVAIARNPAGLKPRKPFWRHGFEGANVQLSRFGASDPAWFGVPLTKEDHERQSKANEGMLARAAKLEVSATPGEVAVKITNESGHKLPTGYPSRRLIVHLKVTAPDGKVVWESGRVDEFGRLAKEPATFFPHFDVVTKQEDVQIYESFPIDAQGKPAHRPLDSLKYGKDNRLVPSGFNKKNSFSAYTGSVGVDQDPDWGSTDTVKYKVGNVPAGSEVSVELLFQVVRPSDIEVYVDKPTPAARRLFDFAKAAPPIPVVIASATTKAP